ncbi:MAG: hypothetical protein K2W85_01545 [Phycisphaerales bacterium]|nr:hypothetical protein [Phycisphaerales bacterium]
MTAMTYEVHFTASRHGRKELREGPEPAVPLVVAEARPARVARLIALAHRIERLVRSGDLRDYAQAARAAGITRARASQIVDLTLLAPDLQERLLLMERRDGEPEPLGEQDLRPIVRMPDWAEQRRVFESLMKSRQSP